MNTYAIISLILLAVVIILGFMVYRNETCSQKDYSKCYLTKDSSTCIPNTLKDMLPTDIYDNVCKNRENFNRQYRTLDEDIMIIPLKTYTPYVSAVNVNPR
mgnify:CR=1 FL=1